MIRCCEACDVEWVGADVPCWVCGRPGVLGSLPGVGTRWAGPFRPRDPAVAAPL